MKPKNTGETTAGNQSVAKALRILQVFTQENPYLRLKDISALAGINQATASRLLTTLKEQGFIAQEGVYYCLGWQVFLRMEGVVLQSMSIRRLSAPYLEQLALLVRKNVNLAVLDGTEVVYIYRAESEDGFYSYYHTGMRRSAHCTSLGKALLCASPEAARPMFAGAGPRRFTFSTITQEDAFMQELEKTRLRGYATDLEECNNGCNCLAVPVKSPAGEVLAAISVSGPSDTFRQEAMMKLLPHLQNTAEKLSLQLCAGPAGL